MGTLLHCVCKKCGKEFMEFEHKKVKKCPHCKSKSFEVKSKSLKDMGEHDSY